MKQYLRLCRQYAVDVRQYLQPGANSLRFTFHPVQVAAADGYSRYPYEIPSNPTPMAFEHYNFVRCAQCEGRAWPLDDELSQGANTQQPERLALHLPPNRPTLAASLPQTLDGTGGLPSPP